MVINSAATPEEQGPGDKVININLSVVNPVYMLVNEAVHGMLGP